MTAPLPPPTRRERFVLTEARPLSPTVRSLTLRTESGSAFPFLAGQHLELLVPTTGLAVRRDYSIASPPDPARGSELELAVTRVADGPASVALHALPIGARIEAHGPKGAFTLRPEPRVPVLFVAHGTGLAPLRAMLLAALRSYSVDTSPAVSPPHFTLLFGVRTERDLLWGDELRALAAARPDVFRFEPTMTRPSDAWTGRRGRVQAHVAALVPPGGIVQVYACGLRDMTDDVARALRALGVREARIFTEEYD